MVTTRRCAIVFFGTPEFAVPTLRALLDVRAHAGRRGRLAAGPAEGPRPAPGADADQGACALAHGIPVLQPERLQRRRRSSRTIAALDARPRRRRRVRPDPARRSCCAIPRLGMINVHASLLPRYRGAAPVHRAVIAGDRETGVTIMRVVKELDAGPMFATARRRSAPTRPATRSSATSPSSAPACCSRSSSELADGRARSRRRRTTSRATYAAKITKAEGAIDWTLPAERIHNLVRGLQPWPLVSGRLDGARVLIHRTALDRRPSARMPRARSCAPSRIGFEVVGRRRTRAAAAQHPARRPARDDRARVPGRPARRARRESRARMIAPARVAAYEVLRAVVDAAAPTCRTRWRAPARGLPDERDRALAGEIATGTLRWQGAFDHVIAELSRRPVAQLDPEVLDILRIAIFQLLHLDRVPASAAVNDAVNLTRKAGKKSAGAARQRGAAPRQPRARRTCRCRRVPRPGRSRRRARLPRDHAVASALAGGAMAGSLRLRRRPRRGAVQQPACAADAAREPPAHDAARRSPSRSPAHGVEVEPGRFAPDALVVSKGNPLLTPLADTGAFVVQDEASQLVARSSRRAPGERVLDACASPGGKTTAMAAAMGDRGLIVATDVRGRASTCSPRTVARVGRAVGPRSSRPTPRAAAVRAAFDWVLLDAPCSGLGTLRRDPDVRWRRSEADLAAARRGAAADARGRRACSRPGGRLVYATCSSEPEENEDVVAAFLAGGAFRPVAPRDLPAPVQPLVNAAGHLRTLPVPRRPRGVLRRHPDAGRIGPTCGTI